MRNLLAFDLGASNGRAILGQFDGEKITMRELHRFENNYIEMNGVFYWDLPYLYNQLKQGFLAFKNANVGELDCFGIDTWGVDYGLLDKNDQLLSNPRSYRYAVDADMEAVWKTVDFPTLFARTGIATMNFNTVYQLYRRKLQDDPALANAQTLLFMPDLLGFFLTGEKKSEYTETTTSMLYNPTTKDWDWQTIEALGLPKKIFLPIDRAGSLRGRLRPELAEELGLSPVDTVMHVLSACEGSVACIYFCINEDDMLNIMRDMRIALGSDGYGFSYDRSITRTNPHPRSFGTFPRFLELARDHRLMPLEDAVYKITGLPADILGLRDRGTLAEGRIADITVFDAERVRDTSEFTDSVRKPEGICHVLVGGEFALRQGRSAGGRKGAVIRRESGGPV